ncbi:MAG TPA: hypothetical protein VMS86_03335, partial [Thermoanaerobaculia bacterium]|nr:hypothetical protein [Thermoanaerobaculia bacterium]
FDATSSPQFFDPEQGENVWEYFFEPVMELSSAGLLERCAAEGWALHRFSFKEILAHHLHDEGRIATFWSYQEPADPAAWMAEKRKLGREYVAKYVRVKPALAAKADAFFQRHLAGCYAIGAHVRGTDFAYADPVEPERYAEAIREHVARAGAASYKVFLATDQEQFVELFGRELGDLLVVSDCLRSRSAVAPFNLTTERSPYRLGEEVLLDVLALSKCRYLVKGSSAVGEYAMWFAPALECTDFALRSRFRPRQLDLLVPAFTRLNVDRRRGPALWASRAWSRLEWPRRLVLAASRLKSWTLARLGRARRGPA